MSQPNKEDRRASASGKRWETWGQQFGFRLSGWTFDRMALFYLPSGATCTVSAEARDAITARLQAATDDAFDNGRLFGEH